MASVGAVGDAHSAERITRPPSMVELAARALRRMILAGDLLPGERVVENQLTQALGVSRPPLREALRVLEREGLVRQGAPRGTIVTPLTLHDVYEIVTMRRELERMAIRLALPVVVPERLERCEAALARMAEAAAAEDASRLSECAFDFHVSVIGLSGHGRLEETYRSLQLQVMLCMALNRRARAQREETMEQDVQRHRRLLTVIEQGDPGAVLQELERHGDRTFLSDLAETLDNGSDQARDWLERLDQGGEP